MSTRAAEAIGERVRQAVARLTAKEAARVTITVGVAAYPQDAVDKNDLIAAADIALYLGKQSGEDRVVRADEVPSEMRDLRSTLDRLARAALLHPDDAPTVDSLGAGRLLSHATEHGAGHRPWRAAGRGALARRAGSGRHRPGRARRPAGRAGGPQAGLRRGAADTVELAAACRAWKGSAPTSWSRSRPREVGEIVRWHRGGGSLERRHWAPRCWPWRTRTTRWWRLQMGRMPSAAQQSTSGRPRPGSASVRMSHALAAVVGVRQRAPQPSQHGDEGPESAERLDFRRDAMIAPPMSSHLLRRRARNPSGLRDAHAGGGTDGLRHDHAQLFSQRSRQPVANERGGQPIGPAQPGATDAAAHADLHQPAGSELAGLIPTRLRGATVAIPPTSEFAMTPGDFAPAYGDLGLQFRALQVAYVNDPRPRFTPHGSSSRCPPPASWSRTWRRPAAMSASPGCIVSRGATGASTGA